MGYSYLLTAALLSVLITTSLSSLPRRPPNQQGPMLQAGGQGLQNRPTQSQKTTDGRRGLEATEEGGFEFKHERAEKSARVAVRRLVELDINKTAICSGQGVIDFDGKNPDSRNVTRESISAAEINDANVDFATKLRMGRPSNGVRQNGTMRGTGQKNRMVAQSGTIVDVETIMKTDDSVNIIEIGNSSSSVRKDDMKVTVTVSGHTFCGFGRICTCNNGFEDVGDYLRVYFMVQSDDDDDDDHSSGSQNHPTPSMSPGGSRVRNDAGTNDVEYTTTLDGTTRMAIGMMNHQISYNDTDLVTTYIDVQSATWTEHGGRTASGFFIDLRRVDTGPNTTYIYDPTMYYDESSIPSSAAKVGMSGLVVLIMALVFTAYF